MRGVRIATPHRTRRPPTQAHVRELAGLMEAWPDLPEHLRATIRMTIEAAGVDRPGPKR